MHKGRMRMGRPWGIADLNSILEDLMAYWAPADDRSPLTRSCCLLHRSSQQSLGRRHHHHLRHPRPHHFARSLDHLSLIRRTSVCQIHRLRGSFFCFASCPLDQPHRPACKPSPSCSIFYRRSGQRRWERRQSCGACIPSKSWRHRAGASLSAFDRWKMCSQQ